MIFDVFFEWFESQEPASRLEYTAVQRDAWVVGLCVPVTLMLWRSILLWHGTLGADGQSAPMCKRGEWIQSLRLDVARQNGRLRKSSHLVCMTTKYQRHTARGLPTKTGPNNLQLSTRGDGNK